jgi:hypothetical protein
LCPGISSQIQKRVLVLLIEYSWLPGLPTFQNN